MKLSKSFILANLTWNSKGWEQRSADRSGFKWVAENPEGNVPGESWNFKPTSGHLRRGFFENLGRHVRRFNDGGVVFFLSRNVSEERRFIVGLYANAKVFETKRLSNGNPYNMEAPSRFCVRLPEYLPFHQGRHSSPHKSPSRYFSYLSDREARNIFADMLGLAESFAPDQPGMKRLLGSIARSYFPSIKATRAAPARSSRDPTAEALREYARKEYDQNTDEEVIRLTKDNAKLQQSYNNHERVRRKIADYLAAREYRLHQDKHLDLSATTARGRTMIVEVKSCRGDNVYPQVRAGVAQLHYYSYLYQEKLGTVRCCLALQSEPPDGLMRYVVEYCGFDLAYLSGGRVVYLKGHR